VLALWWAFGRFVLVSRVPVFRTGLTAADLEVIGLAKFWTGAFTVLWVVIAAAGLLGRRWRPESELWPHLVCQAWGISFAVHC